MLPLMQTSTAFAPSPTNDSFAEFLAKLAALPGLDESAETGFDATGLDKAGFGGFEAATYRTAESSLAEAGAAEADLLEDLSLLSYESALRAPIRVPPRRQSAPLAAKAAEAPSPTLRRNEPKALRKARSFPGFFARKDGKTQPSTALQAAQPQPRTARATVRLTVEENDLLRSRATESGLTVASYIRACIFEIESLRAQVQELAQNQAGNPARIPAMSQARNQARNQARPKQVSVDSEPLALPQTPTQPTLPAQPDTPSLSAYFAGKGGTAQLSAPRPDQRPDQRPAQRPLAPVAARPPQPTPRPRHYDPRVQAAIEAERVRAASQAHYSASAASASAASGPERSPEAKRGLFGFLFGSRRGT
jgi:hypothetical protein